MYCCEFCKKTVKPNTPCRLVVVAKHMHHHLYRKGVIKRYVEEEGRRKVEWADDPGGDGWQIDQEVRLCHECALKWEKEQQASTREV